MKRIILSGLVVVSLLLAGCVSASPIIPVPTPTIMETPKTIEPSVIADVETKMMNDNWISPVLVNIDNFHSGARAEWNIKIHNGNDEVTQIEKKLVTTEINETLVVIPLKYPLANGDISQVSVSSDNIKDNVLVTIYDGGVKSLRIFGFEPDSSRVITIIYKAWSEFSFSYRYPNYARENYCLAPLDAQNWIIISSSVSILSPKETKEILVALDVSQNTTINPIQTIYASDLGKRYLNSMSDNISKHDTPEYKILLTLQSSGSMSIEGLINLNIFPESNIEYTQHLIDRLFANEYLKWSNLKNWEFWTIVKESGQGTYQKEIATRWLVKMR